MKGIKSGRSNWALPHVSLHGNMIPARSFGLKSRADTHKMIEVDVVSTHS